MTIQPDIFLSPPDRRGSDSIKWHKYHDRDVLPLWVADMDFAAPQSVLDAIQERVRHGVLGYGHPPASLLEATLSYLERSYGWKIREEWLVWLPGVVCGLYAVCRLQEGGILTQTPIYPHFLSAPIHSNRPFASANLAQDGNGRWRMDMDALEEACLSQNRLFLLCHPHNPVGRVWERAELETFADFANRHELVVCSDEIHCDLILDEGRQHLPFAMLSPETEQMSITLMSPSKTYNIPGMSCAFAVIPNERLRQSFRRATMGILPHVNILGFVACEAAFREGEAWRQALLGVLRQNRDRLEAAVATFPGVCMSHVEATYLAWLDVRKVKLSDPAAWFERHGLGLADGVEFGAPGWLRFNFACSPALLDLAITRFRHALENIPNA